MVKIRRFFAWGFSLLATGLILGALLVMGVFEYYSRDLPDSSSLANYRPASMTRLYADDGRLMAEYAKEKRIFKPLKDIPTRVTQAFIAAEDRNFYHHTGVDARGVARAAIKNFQNIGTDNSLVGGSTITQQVVKNFLLTNEKSLTRKIKEAILAMRISKVYSKDKILELYLNDIYLGLGAYGVSVAAQRYFDKPLAELSTEEIALLAAMPKAPSAFDPRKNYERALARRNYVIGRMYDDGYINVSEAARAKEQPISLAIKRHVKTVETGYFAEEVRRELQKKYGEEVLYRGGLYVKTTMNPKMQDIADKALRKTLLAYDKRHGYRGAVKHVELKDDAEWVVELQEIAEKTKVFDEQKLAMVLSVGKKSAKIGFSDSSKSVIPFAGMSWAKTLHKKSRRVGNAPKVATDVLKKGDVIIVTPRGFAKDKKANNDENKLKKIVDYNLIQEPEINGAIVVIEPSTGKVLAMSGGYNTDDSFNRATQAKRQPGSAFKPFVYAAALERGFTPASIVVDGPIEISQGEGKPMWRPKNYGGDFIGPATIRMGLEKSRNLMTVRLAQMIDIGRVVAIGKRFGIYNNVPKNYSMVLGSMETSLLKLVNAYAMISNGGFRVEPTMIERIDDNNGKVLYRLDKRYCTDCKLNLSNFSGNVPFDSPPIITDNRDVVLDPRIAYQITSMLAGVVERGTATKAKVLGFPVAGKTGTTNDSRDAWFLGFTRDLAVGVYVGFDRPKSLGRRETGGKVALPAFIEVMGKNHSADNKPRDFYVPKGVVTVPVDRYTGVPPLPWDTAAKVIKEVFLSGGEIFIPEGEDEGLPEVILPFDYNDYYGISDNTYISDDDSLQSGGVYDYSTSNGRGNVRLLQSDKDIVKERVRRKLPKNNLPLSDRNALNEFYRDNKRKIIDRNIPNYRSIKPKRIDSNNIQIIDENMTTIKPVKPQANQPDYSVGSGSNQGADNNETRDDIPNYQAIY